MPLANRSPRCPALGLVASLLLLTPACSSKEDLTQTLTWAIDPVPLLTLGVEEGPSEFEFASITSAVTLPNGGLSVANSGTSEVRFFSSTGAFVRSVGRRGAGPGEYSGAPLYLQVSRPDTLLVFDAGNWRVSRLDSAGHLESSADLSRVDALPFAWLPRVYPNAYLRSDEAPQVRACIDAILPRIAAMQGRWPASLFQVDRLGYLWATALPLSSQTPTTWRIHDLAGALVATATLPAGFTPYVIDQDRILGRLEDSAGVEHVALLSLARREVRPLSCHPPAAASATTDSVAIRSLAAGLRAVIQAQEAYYADHDTYSLRPDDLQLPAFPDARLVLVTADKRHWFGLLIDNRTAITCAGGVGYQPPGWREASPRCSLAG